MQVSGNTTKLRCKKKVMHFATVRNPSSKFFVHWQGSPLVLLQSKDSLRCETVPINAPKAVTEGNLEKKGVCDKVS